MPRTRATCVGQGVLSRSSFEKDLKLCSGSLTLLIMLESSVGLARHTPVCSTIVLTLAGETEVTCEEKKRNFYGTSRPSMLAYFCLLR
jgi:hypothetical protein